MREPNNSRGSIVIIARNSLALTKKSVNTALAQDYPCDVLVVDNNSSDGTLQWLRTKPIAASYQDRWKSLSYCWNSALRAFFRFQGVNEVLACNNDIELLPDTYQLLLDCKLPFVSGVSVNDRSQLVVSTEPLTPRPHPDFSCFMITRETFDRVGPFNEEYYPAYYEDNDYHVRMHRAGIEASCVNVPFYHEGSGTLKSCSEPDRFIIQRGADRGKRVFWKEYGCFPGTKAYNDLFI